MLNGKATTFTTPSEASKTEERNKAVFQQEAATFLIIFLQSFANLRLKYDNHPSIRCVCVGGNAAISENERKCHE